MTVIELSCSVRVTRRLPCSHETNRPCRSTVCPLVYPAGARNTPTAPVVSSQRNIRSFGMSLQTSDRIAGNQAGPSAQRQPSYSFSTFAEVFTHRANRSSIISKSDSATLFPLNHFQRIDMVSIPDRDDALEQRRWQIRR